MPVDTEKIYLIAITTYIAATPLVSTDIDKLFSRILVRVFCQLVVRAGQLATKERLLPTVPSYCASSSLMDCSPAIIVSIATGNERRQTS